MSFKIAVRSKKYISLRSKYIYPYIVNISIPAQDDSSKRLNKRAVNGDTRRYAAIR
jgi:hypothetical protein